MPIVSIIVPVYNTEKYLEECLASIMCQTFKDFEVILVDDGSTDNSGKICDEYARRDPRIKLIHKNNGGVSSARNVALTKAKGDWICFCDSDDMLYPYALQLLVQQIGTDIDCSMGGYVRATPNGEILTEDPSRGKTYWNIEEALIDFYRPNYKMYNGYIWNRLFKRLIIECYSLRFREDIHIKEDGLFVIQYLCRCTGRVVFTKIPTYKYIVRTDSCVNLQLNHFNQKSLTRLQATIECYQEIKKTPYNSVLPFAKNYILYVRDDLLRNTPQKGIGKRKIQWLVDWTIISGCSPILMTPLLSRKIYKLIKKRIPWRK